MTTTEILDKEFNEIKKDLIEKHIELGMRASGKWVESLEVITEGNTTKILGLEYTEQLINGRKPGNRPPIEAIKQWIIDKGIINQIQGKITVTGLAFAISIKIAKSGTRYFQEGGTDLVSSVITPERIQSIIDEVGAEKSINIVQIIQNEFKQTS